MINPIIQEDMQKITQSRIDWHAFEGQTVLISGASGLLPSVHTLCHLNKYFFTRKCTILALVRNTHTAEERFSPWKDSKHLHILEQDV